MHSVHILRWRCRVSICFSVGDQYSDWYDQLNIQNQLWDEVCCELVWVKTSQGYIILHQSNCTKNKTINVVLATEVKLSPVFKSKTIWITLNKYWYHFTCWLMISPRPPCSATLIICSHTRSKQMMKRGLKDISITSCTLPQTPACHSYRCGKLSIYFPLLQGPIHAGRGRRRWNRLPWTFSFL